MSGFIDYSKRRPEAHNDAAVADDDDDGDDVSPPRSSPKLRPERPRRSSSRRKAVPEASPISKSDDEEEEEKEEAKRDKVSKRKNSKRSVKKDEVKEEHSVDERQKDSDGMINYARRITDAAFGTSAANAITPTANGRSRSASTTSPTQSPELERRSASRTRSRSRYRSQSRSRSKAATPEQSSDDEEDVTEPRSTPKTSRRKSSSHEPVSTARATNGAVDSSLPVGDLDLTPQDRHYLNKAFVYLQIQREFSALSQIGDLTHYGEPFLPHPNGPNSRPSHLKAKSSGMLGGFLGGGGSKRAPGWEDYNWQDNQLDSPLLRYLFWRFVYNFPCLREAKPEYWRDQIQPFFDSFCERDLSTTIERSEVTKRRMLAMGFTRILGTYYSTCVTALGPHAPARPSIRVMHQMDHLLPGRMESMWKTEFPGRPVAYNAWTAIVEQDDDEYVIVSRVVVAKPEVRAVVRRSFADFEQLASDLAAADRNSRLNLPFLPVPSSTNGKEVSQVSLQTYLRLLVIFLSSPPEKSDPARAREVLEKFLLGKPERVSKRDLASFIEQAEAQDDRDEKKRRDWVGIGKRAKELRTTWALYRRALIDSDELDKSVALTKKTRELNKLPTSHRDAEIWARIWVSYALHFVFTSSPNAAELTNLVKSFHSLIPYGAMKLGLSLVNPTLAIRAIVTLFLGQPAGQQSLFQRIWSIVLGSQIKSQKKGIESVRKGLANYEGLCDAIRAHVYAQFEQRAATRASAHDRAEDILITIVRDHGSQPDVKLVKGWQKESLRRATSADDSSDAGRFMALRKLLRMECVKRDREQVLDIVLEPNTPQMLHASISVFYSAIYKVANASKLADRLGDLQRFIDDLLEVALSENNSPADYIKLAARHEQDLYYFIHEMASNGGTLMDPFFDWCRSGLNFIKEGVPPVDEPRLQRRGSTRSRRSSRSGKAVEAPRPSSSRASVDYDQLLAETPEETRREVLQEARDLALWASYRKCWADICLRVDLLGVDGIDLGVEKAELYAELLSQDPRVLDVIERRGAGRQSRDRPEDGQEWAWFADDDVLNDPTSIKVDWKAAAQAEKDALEARKKKKGGKDKLSRTTSRMSQASKVSSRNLDEPRIQVPAPRVTATKVLLDKYAAMVKTASDAAWHAKIKFIG